MPTPSPTYCRRAAFDLFADQVGRIETENGLLMAAVALSMHADGDPDLPSRVEMQIDELANEICERVRGPQEQAVLAHAHELMFEERGFLGDTDEYYKPENSYIGSVLERRRGLPITLCLIYKLVLDRCGLHVQGINAPGHFLVSVEAHGADLLVDPFFGGVALSEDEAFDRIAQVTGKRTDSDPRHLAVASHRAWVMRMLRNLRAMFARRRRHEDQAAMVELMRLLSAD